MPERTVPERTGPGRTVPGRVVPGDAAFDGAAYAACTAHHRAHDDDVLAPVPWRPGSRVLDVGCGVGDLTRRVADLVKPGGSVLGVDASPSQVATARTLAGGVEGLRFEVARVQELDAVVTPGWADVVLTVATLHWVLAEDQPTAHAQLARAVAPGGWVRIDMGGRGQIAATREVLDEVAAAHGLPGATWFFPDEAALDALLTGAGLVVEHVRLQRQRRHLPDAAALEAWLRSQVLPGYLRGLPDGPAAAAFCDAAVAAVLARGPRADGSHDQDYVRADALARRPG